MTLHDLHTIAMNSVQTSTRDSDFIFPESTQHPDRHVFNATTSPSDMAIPSLCLVFQQVTLGLIHVLITLA